MFNKHVSMNLSFMECGTFPGICPNSKNEQICKIKEKQAFLKQCVILYTKLISWQFMVVIIWNMVEKTQMKKFKVNSKTFGVAQ